ncbi:MAG: hypothetical protein E7264_00395 [Lachnospiraceae bacterium]|nr:hypothetical protein [Lachnospiraceae bacterium]
MKEITPIKLLYNQREKVIRLCFRLIMLLLFSGFVATVFVSIQYREQYSIGFNFERIKILWLILFVIFTFIVEGVKETGEFLFRYRWFVGGFVLLFLVANKYHCDSITLYDMYVQPNSGNEYVEPLFGQGRGIRSDDWVVTTPSIISNEFTDTPYDDYNEIMRGTETTNGVFGANTSSFLSIGSTVFSFLFGKIDVEYAYSFYWFFPIVLCFLSTLEMGVILTKEDVFLSTLGAVLITFSSWFLWWSFPKQLILAQMSIVLAYYFIKVSCLWKKCFLGLMFAVFFSNFICALYPAWQVPIAYIALVFVIWMFEDNWVIIKKWRYEWIVVVMMFVIVGMFVVHYFTMAEDYITAITQTAYPGERRDYGGMIIERMFYGFLTPLMGYHNLPNPTMISIVCSFFPIPLFCLIYRLIKDKKKDILAIGFSIVSIILTLYCTIGLPVKICDFILLSNSTVGKAVEILSVLQVYVLIYYMKYFSDKSNVSKRLGWMIGIVYSCVCVIYSSMREPNYMPLFYIVVMSFLFAAVIFVMLTKQQRITIQLVFGVVILITLLQGVYIRPISKGLDAIYSKPVAKQIQKICENDEEAKWLAVGDNIFLSGYLLACGAPTVNSTNVYPNIQLWNELDPTGKYEDVYNRYSHVCVSLSEEDTSFELVQSDVIRLKLNHNDLDVANISYIFTTEELTLSEGEEVTLDKVYEEDGSLIYKVVY